MCIIMMYASGALCDANVCWMFYLDVQGAITRLSCVGCPCKMWVCVELRGMESALLIPLWRADKVY